MVTNPMVESVQNQMNNKHKIWWSNKKTSWSDLPPIGVIWVTPGDASPCLKPDFLHGHTAQLTVDFQLSSYIKNLKKTLLKP